MPTRCSRRLQGVAPLASEITQEESRNKRRRTTRGGGGKVADQVELATRELEMDQIIGDTSQELDHGVQIGATLVLEPAPASDDGLPTPPTSQTSPYNLPASQDPLATLPLPTPSQSPPTQASPTQCPQPQSPLTPPRTTPPTSSNNPTAVYPHDIPLVLGPCPPAPHLLVEGHFPLRIIYSSTLLMRRNIPALKHEWSSRRLLARMAPAHRQKFAEQIRSKGTITLPGDIFHDVWLEEDKVAARDLIYQFCEWMGLPHHGETLSFEKFVGPQGFEPRRMLWWRTLAQEFGLAESQLGDVFLHIKPGAVHDLWHAMYLLRTLAEFSSVCEELDEIPMREMVHHEMARRLASGEQVRKARVRLQMRLVCLGHEELRAKCLFAEEGESTGDIRCLTCYIIPPSRGLSG
jgi:hypothetical protein